MEKKLKLPRKLKKIAKSAIFYSPTEYFNKLWIENYPGNGVLFGCHRRKRIFIKNKQIKYKDLVYKIVCGKKVMKLYYEGYFDF